MNKYTSKLYIFFRTQIYIFRPQHRVSDPTRYYLKYLILYLKFFQTPFLCIRTHFNISEPIVYQKHIYSLYFFQTPFIYFQNPSLILRPHLVYSKIPNFHSKIFSDPISFSQNPFIYFQNPK